MDAFLSGFLEHYNWLASLLALAGVVVLTKLGKFLVFKVPALAEARAYNMAEDKKKWHKEKYPPMVRASQKVGMYSNIAFFLAILPFCVSLEVQPWWQVPLDIVIILMFYDFVYYLSHRFWFHGQGAMRKVHAVHHQARQPTHLDAHYVHPLETFIGLALYFGSIAVLAALLGPFQVVTIVLTFVVFTQLNTINHTHVGLHRFPYRTLTWITEKHHRHHENMHMGNYATITLLYDRLFGTFE